MYGTPPSAPGAAVAMSKDKTDLASPISVEAVKLYSGQRLSPSSCKNGCLRQRHKRSFGRHGGAADVHFEPLGAVILRSVASDPNLSLLSQNAANLNSEHKVVSMTFKQFLASQRPRHDAKGDYLRLASADPDFPVSESWEEVQSYMTKRHDNSVLTYAAADVWKEYQASVSKLRKAK